MRYLDDPDGEQDDAISGSARRARESGWDYQELVGPHDLHVSDPQRVALLLAAFA